MMGPTGGDAPPISPGHHRWHLQSKMEGAWRRRQMYVPGLLSVERERRGLLRAGSRDAVEAAPPVRTAADRGVPRPAWELLDRDGVHADGPEGVAPRPREEAEREERAAAAVAGEDLESSRDLSGDAVPAREQAKDSPSRPETEQRVLGRRFPR